MKKEWRPVVGYEGLYEVSNYGEVASLNYRGSGKRKVLKPGIDGGGYEFVTLNKNGIPKMFRVHRLVASAFIENPDNLPVVDHIDGNVHNNMASNLRFCTQKENLNFELARANKSKAAKEAHNRPETKANKSKAARMVWNRPGYREKISKAMSGNHNRTMKPVIQLTRDGEFVAWFPSGCDAHRQTGVNQGGISSCCMGKLKYVGGFIWRYA